MAASDQVPSPVNEALFEPAKAIWQTSSPHLQHVKELKQKYYVADKGFEFLFTHSSPNSLVVDAISECGRQPLSKATPYNKDQKCLDLFGRKSYSSTALQFQIVSE